MKVYKRIFQFLLGYWLEILIFLVLVILPFGWKYINLVLDQYGIKKPTIFYLACEVIYDTAAALALYYLDFWRPVVKSMRIRFASFVQEYGRGAYALLPFWLIKSLLKILVSLKENMQGMRPRYGKFKFWFGINRVVALVQPAATMGLVFLYGRLPWIVAIPVYGFLLADFVSTILILWGLSKRLNEAEQEGG